MIQPKEGEINYDLAHKNPLKFYDKVMQQDITEHKVQKSKQVSASEPGHLPQKKKVSKQLQMTSQVTKRTVARVLAVVDIKL